MWKLGVGLLVMLGAPATGFGASASEAYEKARAAYYGLKADPGKQQFRHHWLPVIQGFERIVKNHPESPEAPKAAYTAAHLTYDLYDISRAPADCDAALMRYSNLAENYPKSSLADDALYEKAGLLLRRGRAQEAANVLRALTERHPKGDMFGRAQKRLASLDVEPAHRANAVPATKVVLDPGHGGRDRGATGHGGLEEATVNLQIAERVAKRLRAKGIEVVLTRDSDEALSLSARAEVARGADLFISIHANAAESAKAHGIETYYLDVTHDRYAKRLAQRENNGAEMDELEFILADLATKVSARESKAFAGSVQKRLVQAARGVNRSARDLGVKSAMFHVLLGARCPAILIETAFVSNPREAEMLRRADYQTAIADAIADGVKAHLAEPVLASR